MEPSNADIALYQTALTFIYAEIFQNEMCCSYFESLAKDQEKKKIPLQHCVQLTPEEPAAAVVGGQWWGASCVSFTLEIYFISLCAGKAGLSLRD